MIASAAAALGGAIGGYGKKPKVPDFQPINVNAVQSETVAGNAKIAGQAQNLAAGVNQFSLEQLTKALDFLAPGAREQAVQNINNMLSGTADMADLQAGIRGATAAGYNLGVGGSQFSRFGVAGQLGRSVAQQRQQGLQNLLGFSSLLPKQFDVSSMFFTPQQRVAIAIDERNSQFQRDLLNEQLIAAPDPAMKAIAEGIMADDAYWGQVTSSMMGGMGGGGGAPKVGG